MQALIKHSNSPSKSATPQGLIVGKQLSDFHISSMIFSPFHSPPLLVSCGRENIRFWRIKKGHLPARPVTLNEYSRGYVFQHLGIVSTVGVKDDKQLRSCVFVTSSKGTLLRVDCETETVVCAYQLHHGPICSFAINTAYAVLLFSMMDSSYDIIRLRVAMIANCAYGHCTSRTF